jgi:hypothetical protein
LTVLLFAVVLGIVVLVNGIALILAVTQFITAAQDGTIPGIDALNGLNGLQGGAGNGLTPDQMTELGL